MSVWVCVCEREKESECVGVRACMRKSVCVREKECVSV